MKKKYFKLAIVFLCGVYITHSYAEIDLVKQDLSDPTFFNRLNLRIGGSIRPEYNKFTGNADRGAYQRNLFDGLSRFRFSLDYYLFDDINLVGFYELGVNFPRIIKWHNHYASNDVSHTTRRLLYFGFSSTKWGNLTFGQQHTPYYEFIAKPTDYGPYARYGQATRYGVSGDFDGSYRTRKILKYKKRIGDADLLASYYFKDRDFISRGGLRYQRSAGGSLGFNYHINSDLTFGSAWSYMRANVHHPRNGNRKNYDQHIFGTSLEYKPDNWTLITNYSYLRNFTATGNSNVDQFFAKHSWGMEYFLSYKFNIEKYKIKSISPYFQGGRLEYYTDGRDYKRTDNGLGLNFQFDYGFRFAAKYVFISTTNHRPGNAVIMRLYYDF